MTGYLYVAINAAMPGLVKVGRTAGSPTQRMAELHSTGVPEPFQLVFAAKVADSMTAERLAHEALADCRVSKSREFFRAAEAVAIERILATIGECAIDWQHTQNRPQIERLAAAFREKLENDRLERERAAKERAARERAEREREAVAERSRRRLRELDEQATGLAQQLRKLGPVPEKGDVATGAVTAYVMVGFCAYVLFGIALNAEKYPAGPWMVGSYLLLAIACVLVARVFSGRKKSKDAANAAIRADLEKQLAVVRAQIRAL
jgi:hypothetical protein